MNSRFDMIGAIQWNVSHNMSSCNSSVAKNLFYLFLAILIDGQRNIRQSSYGARTSDFEILTTLSRQEKLYFVPEDIDLARISCRYFRVVGPCKDFVAIWIDPCWFE